MTMTKQGCDNKGIRVENIVASASTGVPFDLDRISLNIEEAEYTPAKFPGLIYKLKKPKTALLLFTSGKLVCTGAKNVDMVQEAVNIVLENISKIGIEVTKDPEIIVQNIVATTDLKAELNLNTVAISLGMESVEYEPEQFPGLVFRVREPKVVALLFGSGRVVLTGAKKLEDLDRAFNEIKKELSNAGLI